MDDVTTILQTAPCTARLLKRLDELIQWARMKIKPSKSRSLSIRKGVRDDRTVFTAGGEKIPLLKEQSIRSLGREYTSELSDRQMGKLVQKQLREGLEKIDSSQLPGKLKVWCYQFTLFQRVMWPLKVSEIPSSLASRMDIISNTYIRKWLGLPRCFSSASFEVHQPWIQAGEDLSCIRAKGIQGRSSEERRGNHPHWAQMEGPAGGRPSR